jgi:secreted PhoX family phosphatase
MLSRRAFILGTGAAGAILALRHVLSVPIAMAECEMPPFGPLQPDPNRILDLPQGFTYKILSRTGTLMNDGLQVPGLHDGMAAFAVDAERVTLICNHELDFDDTGFSPYGADGALLKHIAREKFYDAGGSTVSLGGTTSLIYNTRTQQVEHHFLSLAGTERNCAGGPTPWNSWLSCEETVSVADGIRGRDHGWVFEVPASARTIVDPVPIKSLGRFFHEAVAIDPHTGVLYQTEDREDGLIYRLLPDEKGNIRSGRLQALALREWKSADTRNWQQQGQFSGNASYSVYWIDLDHTDAPDDDLRQRGHQAGAAIFARGEGMWFGNGELYFACTSGGFIRAGQIFRYRPSRHEGTDREPDAPGQLSLLVESTDRRQLENCDNITVTPWGDVLICEDAITACSLVGVTPSGNLYHFGENAYSDSELAGACFAPDGKTLFVNIQNPGLTLAITGPFPG